MKKIVVIDGHPDSELDHLVHALAEAYADGARLAGHHVTGIRVATLDFPILSSASVFHDEPPPPDVHDVQVAIQRADHVTILFPLWFGTAPALLQGFFEQVFRPGYAREREPGDAVGKALLTGKSAHLVVTMAMPVWALRWVFGAPGLKTLERHLLKFVGFAPIRRSLFGRVESVDDSTRRSWIERIRNAGAEAR